MNELARNKTELAAILEKYLIEDFDFSADFPLVMTIVGKEVISVVSFGEFFPDVIDAMNETERVLDWHHSVYVLGAPNPGGLGSVVRAQGLLARHLETIGHELAEAVSDQERSRSLRTFRRNKIKVDLMRSAGMSATQAESEARVECESLDGEHVEAIKRAGQLRSIYKSMEATSIALSQERKRLDNAYERAHLTA